jgi:hypothetical protein
VPSSALRSERGETPLGDSPVERAGAELERVRALQGRIRQMQKTRLDDAGFAVLPALAPLLPGGTIKAGGAYSVVGSIALVMALLAAPSRSGAWCAVVGIPEFGIEAAGRAGLDPSRLVLVPRPREHWLTVTATLAEALHLVVTRPGDGITDSDAARLGARLRGRGSALIVLGDWPRIEARLSITASEWSGLGAGHGYLASRRVTVTAASRAGAGSTSARLWLPDADEQVVAQSPVREAPRIGPRPLHAPEAPAVFEAVG